MKIIDVFRILGISRDPSVEKLVGDLESDFTGGVTLNLATVETQVKDFADAIGVAAATFPEIPGLQTIHDTLYERFGFPKKVGSMVSDALAALLPKLKLDVVGAANPLDVVNQAVAAWLSAHTGIPAESFGPWLNMADQIITTVLLGLLGL